MPALLPRRSPALLLALAGSAAFVALTVAVATGRTAQWDQRIREWGRPGDSWGPNQKVALHAVSIMDPVRAALGLALVTVLICLVRRSLRPAMLAVMVGVTGSLVSLGAKLAFDRPNPLNTANEHGGSYPSGHVQTILLTTGLALLLAFPRPRWWMWLGPLSLGCVMSLANVLIAMHWTSDLAGGGLLAVIVLAATVAGGWPEWAATRRAVRPPARRAARPAATQDALDHP
jgi:membrane-associated phospholipid phosphatase